MINWPNYNNNQAEKDFELIQANSDKIMDITISNEFLNLRNTLLKSRDTIYDKYHIDEKGIDSYKYAFDLEFGLDLYQILQQFFNFTNRDASNDDVWRYLSIKVIPDIVHSRYGLSNVRYYKLARRIWLKQIYWYIHLAWQGDKETTFNILKNNTTDTIMNIVERPGKGYNIELIREILRQYPSYDDSSRNILRRVLVFNTALSKSASPEFIEGGIETYVKNLFDRVV